MSLRKLLWLTSIIATTFSIYWATTTIANEINPSEDYSHEPPWIINPYGAENPLFYGGPLLFASSRMGQVYMPGLGVGLGRPLFMLSSHMVGNKAAIGLTGITTDLLAHMSWRLGCDQGYLMALDLKFDDHASISDFLMGSSDNPYIRQLEALSNGNKYNPHPTLSNHHNGSVTLMALALFGVGQVIGQRYFGPWVTKHLGNTRLFGQMMGPRMSRTTMDVFGWPVYNGLFSRAEAVGKFSGILMGTYLGWSLNDVGYQMAHWRKISIDPFSERMPYFGYENFGNIDKGWGILGFTIGGMLGHNIGATLGEAAVYKWFKPGGFFLRGPQQLSVAGSFLKHSGAIVGNVTLGLALTSYFPHLYRKIFHKYEKPVVTSPFIDPLELPVEERNEFIKKYVTTSLNNNFMELFQMGQKNLPQVQKDLAIKVARMSEDDKQLIEDEMNKSDPDYTPDKTDYQAVFAKDMENNQETLYKLIEFMGASIQSMIALVGQKMDKIKTKSELKEYIKNVLDSFLPSEFFLSDENKAQALSKIVNSIDEKDGVETEQDIQVYRKRLIRILVRLYPMVFKHDYVKRIEILSTNMSSFPNASLHNLLLKRDSIALQLKELHEMSSLNGNAQFAADLGDLKALFHEIHKTLVKKNMEYYKSNPDLLVRYSHQLDQISARVENLKNSNL